MPRLLTTAFAGEDDLLYKPNLTPPRLLLKIMSITPEFATLVNRLNQELDRTEAQATKGLNLARELLSSFPDNVTLVQYFAYLNAAMLFVETSRRHTQRAIGIVRPTNVPPEIVRETGESLGNLLGQVLEAKLRIEEFVDYLER